MSEAVPVARPRWWLRGLVGFLLLAFGFVLGVISIAIVFYHEFSESCPVPFQPMPGDELGVAHGPGFLPPRTISHPLRFPPAAGTAFLQGRVAMLVYVQADGRVGQAHVLRPSGFCPFDAEAQRAVPQWRFAPATSFGKPIATWWVVTVEFDLKDRNGVRSNRAILQPLPPPPPPPPVGHET